MLERSGRVEKLAVCAMARRTTWDVLQPRASRETARLAQKPVAVAREPDRRPHSDPRPFLAAVGQRVRLALRNGFTLEESLTSPSARMTCSSGARAPSSSCRCTPSSPGRRWPTRPHLPPESVVTAWSPAVPWGASMPLAFALVVSLTAGASPTGSSATFAKLAEQFIHESLALSPVTASQAGYHQHRDSRTGKTVALDAVLDDVSPAGMARQRTFLLGWRDRLEKQVPRASLGLQDSVDRRLLDDQIAATLLDLDRIQSFQHNPTVYVEMLGSGLFQPLSDDYAPKDVRLSHILSRIAEVPRFLRQARENLTDSDPIYVKVAIEENEGNVQLIETTIGKEIPTGSPLRARFDQVAPPPSAPAARSRPS